MTTTYKEVLDKFRARDENAVIDFNNNPLSYTMEGKLSFLSARLEDTMQVLVYVLRRLIEEETGELPQ